MERRGLPACKKNLILPYFQVSIIKKNLTNSKNVGILQEHRYTLMTPLRESYLRTPFEYLYDFDIF